MENITVVSKRIYKDKMSLIEQLKKTPVIQVACEKTGVSRATYYRWRKEDQEFAKIADEAINEGASLVSDMAESQLMSAIRDKNMTAIIFWLKHHHPSYTTKVEILTSTKFKEEPLTDEQKNAIKIALGLINSNSPDQAEEIRKMPESETAEVKNEQS